jgi:hypothetical protein
MRPSDRVFDTPVSQGRMRPEMNALHIAHDVVQLSKHWSHTCYSFILQSRQGIFRLS